jgi:hypothetical protein
MIPADRERVRSGHPSRCLVDRAFSPRIEFQEGPDLLENGLSALDRRSWNTDARSNDARDDDLSVAPPPKTEPLIA